MKTTLTILIAIFCLNIQAQNWKRPVGIIAYHVGTVALGAVADGLYDDGHKNLSHALHAAEVGALIGGPFVFHVKRSEALSYVLSYGFIRLSLFDAVYNGTRDLPLLYNGTTSTYDKVMGKIPPDGRAFIKSWSFVVGISIPICELY